MGIASVLAAADARCLLLGPPGWPHSWRGVCARMAEGAGTQPEDLWGASHIHSSVIIFLQCKPCIDVQVLPVSFTALHKRQLAVDTDA